MTVPQKHSRDGNDKTHAETIHYKGSLSTKGRTERIIA